MSFARSGHRARWSATVAAALAGAALGAGMAFVTLRAGDQVLEARVRADLEVRSSGVERMIENLGADLVARLRDFSERLSRAWPDEGPAARLARGGRVAYGVAPDLAALSGIEGLEFLDEHSIVLSSARWPEQAGMEAQSAARIAPGTAELGRLRQPGVERLALVGRVPLRLGERQLSIVGARPVDERLLEQIAAGGSASLYDPDRTGGPKLVRIGPARLDAERWVALAGPEASGAGPVVVRETTGGRTWSALGVPLAGSAVLVLAVPREDLDRAGARLGRWLAVGALVGTALAGAGGAWLVSALRRPIDRAVRAVEAIAAGQADYTFAHRPADEAEELAAAFSRLSRALDEQRSRAAALARVGAWREAARHLAHDVKNPLAPIRLTMQNLRRARARDPELFERMFDQGVTTVLEEVERLDRRVGEFAEFARMPAPSPRPVDLHRVLDGVLALAGAEPRLRVVRDYDPALPQLSLDEDQITRCFQNLVANAIEAMGEQATADPLLEIRTRREGEVVLVEVADRGTGFTEEVERNLFRPDFTTKPRGTGLGLVICERIVTEHGGEIRLRGRAGGGAHVEVRLPLAHVGRAAQAGRSAGERS